MGEYSYNGIDRAMKEIAKENNISPLELHNEFKETHDGMVPDEWVKKQVYNEENRLSDEALERAAAATQKRHKEQGYKVPGTRCYG